MAPCEISIEEGALLDPACPADADIILLTTAAGNNFLRMTWAQAKKCLSEQEVILADIDVAYDLNPGYLTRGFIIIPGADTTISIGLTPGTDELGTGDVTAADGEPFLINKFTIQPLTYYITGLNTGSKIIVLKEYIYTS